MARWVPAALIFLILLLFGPTTGHGRVWDDHDLLERNPLVTGPLELPALLSPYWAESGTPGTVAYSRPLVTFTFAVQHAVHGLEPVGYHLFNIMLHALAVVALYRLFLELAGSWRASGLAAAFFAVFPTQVEPVAWISGRTDLLAGGLGFLAMLCHRRARGIDGWSVGAGAALLGSILSKEVGWMFVPLLAAHDRLRPAAGDGETARAGATWRRWIPLGLAVGVGLAARLAALGLEQPPSTAAPAWIVPLRMATSAGHYLRMLVWPWDPSALPAGRGLAPPTSPLFLAGLLALVMAPLLARRAARRGASGAAFALLWIMLGLLPVLNLVPISAPSPVAERFWYVPLGGVALGLALGLEAIFRRCRNISGAATGGVVLILLALTAASAWRVPEWASDRALWEAEAGRHGLRHPLAARNLGLARLKEGDPAGAERVWREALSMGLGGGTSHYFELGASLGRLLVGQHRSAEAASLMGRLLALEPPPKERAALEAVLDSAGSVAGAGRNK